MDFRTRTSFAYANGKLELDKNDYTAVDWNESIREKW